MVSNTTEITVPAAEESAARPARPRTSETRPSPRRQRAAFTLLRRQPVGAISIAFLLLCLVMAALAEYAAPYSPETTGLGASFAGPSWAHPFGLDQLGRDMLSRVIWGARLSFITGLSATALALAVGTVVGVASAYFGGLLDLLSQRVIEILNVFPSLVLALLLVAMFGQSTLNIVLALAVSMAPGMARLVRSAVLSVRALPYVEAAQAVGVHDVRLMVRHIVPNVAGPIMVMATLAVGGAITAEASLAFLGVGGSPGSPSWGRMLAQAGSEHIRYAPHLAYFPGAVLTLVVLAVNFAGDAVRDLADPRARRRG